MEGNYLELSPPLFRRLDDRQLKRIHEATLHILSRIGVTVDCAEALELLDGHNPKPLGEDLLSEIKKMEKSWFECLGLDHTYPE